jgi:hypothetical protein
MMHFIPFQPEHFLWIMDVDEHSIEVQGGMDLLALAKLAQQKGPCFTLVRDAECVACGGLSFMFKQSAEIWLRMSKRVGAHVAKEVREEMYRLIEKHDLVRLQASGPVSWKQLPRWWEWLGMHREGILKRYGPHGEDYFMYAWVRE